MKIGIIGLGRMGYNMALRLLREGHQVVAYNRTYRKAEEIAEEGAVAAPTIEDLVEELSPPRAVWIMLPAGKPTREAADKVSSLLSPEDTIIDGGNSHYRDSIERAITLKSRNIHFLDVGTSGGIWGLEAGYCMMVGGPAEAFVNIEPALATLAPEGGYAHVGPSGAGHFTKMIHNGIEYAMLEAYGEGFELLATSDYDFDLAALCRLWNNGSVIRSWLLELTESAFNKDPKLAGIKGFVEDSGEGRWTVLEAIDRDIPAAAIALSLFKRFRSRQDESFSAKVIAALRNEFGGHRIKK